MIRLLNCISFFPAIDRVRDKILSAPSMSRFNFSISAFERERALSLSVSSAALLLLKENHRLFFAAFIRPGVMGFAGIASFVGEKAKHERDSTAVLLEETLPPPMFSFSAFL